MSATTSAELAAIEGQIERITFANPVNHYTVARLTTKESKRPITITGHLAGITAGEFLKITGIWERHPKYGQQFKVSTYEITLPSTVESIRQYLRTGVIKGIGPNLADRIVDHLGAATLELIETHPARLLEVTGVGKIKLDAIQQAWRMHHQLRGLMQFLQQMGINASHGAKLLAFYGDHALKTLKETPYQIALDMPELGFAVADKVAQASGAEADAPTRYQACLTHILRQAGNEGHTCLPQDIVLDRCETVYGLDRLVAAQTLGEQPEESHLVVETDFTEPYAKLVYSKTLHQAETGIAARLNAMLSIPAARPTLPPEQILEQVQRKLALNLSTDQLDVVQQILNHRVVIITGGPGTGKTTLIRAISTVFETLKQKIALAAPTGRAARRLGDVTGRQARTIHRLLGVNFLEEKPQALTFVHNEDNPLRAGVVIVDEVSMVDALLMERLLRAVSMTTPLILVGDAFQLPSVGPGNVLADLIRSDTIPVFHLIKIHRQAHKSPIVVNAHRIRLGENPVPAQWEDRADPNTEFFFLEAAAPEKAVSAISQLCARTIPARFGLNPIQHIQVLTPVHKGPAGTINLNQALQSALNPAAGTVSFDTGQFKTGDKIMHLKNNYQKDVFNGDIGTVSAIDTLRRQLTVDYEGRGIDYDFNELNQLSLAYAISIHKSQGSEYPAVVVPLLTQHYIMLQRNLLYTAVTRGKQLVVLVGAPKALKIAIRNDKPRRRLTRLAQRLQNF